MAGDFFQTVVRENRQLFSLLYRFNCQPALDIHPDHVSDFVDADFLSRLCDCPQGERRISDCITRRFDLDPAGHWRFEDPRVRLAALSRDHLQPLITMTGAALLHRSINRIIERDRLRDVKQTLGEPIYLFAVKRAPFLAGSLSVEASDLPPTEKQQRWIDVAGLQCISECIGKFPKTLYERLRLKLPRDADLSDIATDVSDAKFNLVKRILLSEIDPNLAPCFN